MLDNTGPAKNPITFLTLESRTVPEMFLKRVKRSPGQMAWMKKAHDTWVASSWSDFYQAAASVASFLIKKGLKPGDKVCIMGWTKPEWCISDIGGLLAGCITLGAYPTLAPTQLAYLLDHSDTKVLFIDSRQDLQKVLGIRHQLPKLELLCIWRADGLDESIATNDWLMPFEDLLRTPVDREQIEKRVDQIDPEDTAIIVYTSGTTGPPKGAMISHTNILFSLQTQQDLMPFSQEDFGLSFLPMAHVAERVLNFYWRISTGLGTAFATSVSTVLGELKEVRPTLFASVPRVFEKGYSRIMDGVAKASPGRQRIFRWAEATGREVVRKWQAGESIPATLRLKHKLVDLLVFSRIREAFGGKVKFFFTGAAPIAPEILEFFWAAGFPIYEAYGMTEISGVSHGNRPGAIRLGSVGMPYNFVEDRLAEDGEILVRGKMVFKGYYKNAEDTSQAVDEQGWLHTGDMGHKDADGYLYIVDRKKHIIITAGGKNVAPANIENEIKRQDPLISQVHVHGDKRPYLTALVTIHPLEAVEWAKERGLIEDLQRAEVLVRQLTANPLARPQGLEELMHRVSSHEVIRNRVVKAFIRGNANLSRVETVRKINLLNRDLSLEEGEVTPTLKVKRKDVEKRFSKVFDRLYGDASFGIVIPDNL